MFAFNAPAGFPVMHGMPMPIAEPQAQHFAAPIVNQQGQPVGQVEVHEEVVPVLEVESTEKDLKSAKDELARYILCVASFLKELETQSHLVHLNYQGSNFLSIHNYLKAQYDKHLEQFDRVAESLRTLDYYMPMCSKGLVECCHDFKHCTSHESKEMLATYLCNIESLGMKAKCMGKLASKSCAPDIENLAADLVEAMFHDAYLIKSTLRD
jgi:DNA-binding ferritin-like protein